MLETFISLLAGHLLGDFVLQSRWMVDNKKKPVALVAHVTVVTTASILIVGTTALPVIAITFLSHIVMDAIKAIVLPDNLFSFIFDQTIHLLVIVYLAVSYPSLVMDSLWPKLLDVSQMSWYFLGLTVLCGLVLTLRVGGFLIGLILQPMAMSFRGTSQETHLVGGVWLGYSERLLVFLSLFLGATEMVGFIVAAKSIMLSGGIKSTEDRSYAIYILCGTFISVCWAIGVTALTLQVCGFYLTKLA